MNQTTDNKSLIQNCRVLDLTDEKGYYCGRILGDLGADVIKIEHPQGDSGRNIGPFYKDIVDPEKSLYWMYFNASKRSITLDIETSAGREIFTTLVKRADIVIESFSPGYMKNLGFDYDHLSTINKRIIMVSISPFGQTGPHKDFKGSDMVTWAMSSSMALTGKPDRPVRISVPQGYLIGGSQAAAGTMMAYYHQKVAGEGQHIDVSIQEAGMITLLPALETWHVLKQIAPRIDYGAYFGAAGAGGMLRSRYIWPCKDGYVCMYFLGGANLGMTKSSTELTKWAFSEGMALELKDYDWSKYDSSKITQEERDRLNDIIIPFLQTKTKKELYDVARQRGILLSPCNNIKDVLQSTQLEARGFWHNVEHKELGDTITYPSSCFQINEHPVQMSRRAPLIGEHNEDVYINELMFTRQKYDEMKHARVL